MPNQNNTVMMEDTADFETQTRERLLALLDLLEQDKSALSSAAPGVARSGEEVYGQFMDEVRRGLDCLDRTLD